MPAPTPVDPSSAPADTLALALRERRRAFSVLAAALGLAAVNFFVNLGTGSLFVDEVYSWRAASVSFGSLISRVRMDEVAPPLYYSGLHEWIFHLGRQSEWVMRLPSAVAAVGLVVAVCWLGNLVEGRLAGAVAAVLAGLSPLVLEYGQQVRAYVFAMLLVTVAVALVLQAERTPKRARTCLTLAGAAMVLALWTHYTANLVLVPLVAWLWWSRHGGRSARIALTAVLALADAAVAPLAHEQLGRGHQAGVAAAAHLTLANFVRNLGFPFDGRVERVTPWVVLGAGATCAAIMVVLVRRRDRRLDALLLLLATAPLAVILAFTVAGTPSLLSRYDAIGAPFLIVAIAIAVVRARRSLRWALLLAAVAAGLGGSVLSHQARGYFPDMRGAMTAIGERLRPGDVIFLAGYPAIGSTVEYYVPRLGPGAPLIFPGQAPTPQAVIAARTPFWTLSSTPQPSAGQLSASLERVGYRLTYLHVFPATTRLTALRAEPDPPSRARAATRP